MRAISWKLLATLSISLAFRADAVTASGYKGIDWGTPCGEAVQKMEAKGFVFDRKDKVGLPGQARSPQASQLFLVPATFSIRKQRRLLGGSHGEGR